MTSSVSSQSPFAPATAAPRQRRRPGAPEHPLRAPFLGTRLFTPPPFAPTKEPFAAVGADPAEDSAASKMAARLVQVGLGLTDEQVSRLLQAHAVSADCYAPTLLHRRDRSVYDWFESIGFFLTFAALGAACAALLIG